MARKFDVMYINYYTEGSAARNLAPAFPETPRQRKQKAKKQQKTVIYFDPVAIGSLLVAVVLLITMAVGLTRFQAAQAEKLAMEQYVSRLTAENHALQQKYQAGLNLEEVEKTALALGMVPVEQVQTITITLHDAPPEEVTVTVWDQLLALITNLFA